MVVINYNKIGVRIHKHKIKYYHARVIVVL